MKGKTPAYLSPFTSAGFLNIGVGTATNYGAGKLGELIGVPMLRVGDVSAPNVFGPALNIGSNAAGNAAGTEIIDQINK